MTMFSDSCSGGQVNESSAFNALPPKPGHLTSMVRSDSLASKTSRKFPLVNSLIPAVLFRGNRTPLANGTEIVLEVLMLNGDEKFGSVRAVVCSEENGRIVTSSEGGQVQFLLHEQASQLKIRLYR